MNKLVTLFYGPKESRIAYRPLFGRWIQHHEKLGLADRIVVVSEDRGVDPPVINCVDSENSKKVEVIQLDVSGYADVMRPGQPFDMKGALLCELLLQRPEAFLMLDNDAFLQRADYLDHPELPKDAVIAMPRDLGALGCSFGLQLHPPYAHVSKRCAGVMFCGPVQRVGRDLRKELVSRYCDAWKELLTGGEDGGIPWEKHLSRLLEQHAWSYAAQQMEQPLLSDAWNWPDHFADFGVEKPEEVFVHHYFGRKKWGELGRKAPQNV